MAYNALELSNVTLGEQSKSAVSRTKADCHIVQTLAGAIWDLARERPLWTFVAQIDYGNVGLTRFAIFQDGEQLGIIERGYFRGEYCIEVTNFRIRDSRQRKGGYRTKDTNKAVATVKKMFTRKGFTEVIADAVKNCDDIIEAEQRQRDYDRRRNQSLVESAMLRYVRDTVEGRSMFMRHLRDSNQDIVLNSIEKVVELENEIRVVNELALSNTAVPKAIVVRIPEGYVVREGTRYGMKTDAELSHEMCAKLGMLKLVEPKHFIEAVGGRIDENTFLLQMEPNNVSQEGESNGV